MLLLLISGCGKPYNPVYTYPENKLFQDIITLEGFVEPVKSVTLTAPGYYDLVIVYLVDHGSKVKKGDTLCILESDDLRSNYNRYEKYLFDQKAQFHKLKANMELQNALLEAEVKNNDINSSINFLDSLQFAYSSPVQKRISELELQKTIIIKQKLEKKLDALKEINANELKKSELRIKQTERRYEKLKKDLEELVLIAPQDGLALIASSYFSSGQLEVGNEVWSGMPLLTIPDLTLMQVLLSVSESDAKRIKTNQNVEISFSAVPGLAGSGRIKRKAPIGKPLERNSKIKVFDVIVSLDDIDIMPEPGISALCKITVQEMDSVLVVPQIAVYEMDKQKFVYTELDGDIFKKEVETGFENLSEVVVDKGLSKHEKVLLFEPEQFIVSELVLLDSVESGQIF